MPNLLPTEELVVDTEEIVSTEVEFGHSFRFDFTVGEFIYSPTGKVVIANEYNAWLEWCQKAMLTSRYRHPIYSGEYGQEFDELIRRSLSRAANESEIVRDITECLLIDPRTASVSNFLFRWEGDTVIFSCEIKNVRDETGTLEGEVYLLG